MSASNELLQVEQLTKRYPIEKGLFRRVVGHVQAVNGATFSIHEGEVLGVVGESGCGKTTLGRCILRAIEPDSGSIRFRFNGKSEDITGLTQKSLRPYRRHMQMVFQDPYGSLDPRMTVLDIVAEPLRAAGIEKRDELEKRVKEIVAAAGLNVEHIKRYPHAFSGGQRQRIAIARALATRPSFVVADEPVSALDVSVRAEILNLLRDLQQDFGLSTLFIAHDLSVVRYISDRVAVMYVGNVVELASAEHLYNTPRHPYTEALLSAIPVPDPRTKTERVKLEGEIPDPSNPPTGCPFHPRCRYATDECAKHIPPLRELADGHSVACHYADELELKGTPATQSSPVTEWPLNDPPQPREDA